jgi:hypothetical protein
MIPLERGGLKPLFLGQANWLSVVSSYILKIVVREDNKYLYLVAIRFFDKASRVNHVKIKKSKLIKKLAD